MTNKEKRIFLDLCIQIGVLSFVGGLLLFKNWEILPEDLANIFRIYLWFPAIFGFFMIVIPLILRRRYPLEKDIETKEFNKTNDEIT